MSTRKPITLHLAFVAAVVLACGTLAGDVLAGPPAPAADEGDLFFSESSGDQSTRAERLNSEGYLFPKRGEYHFLTFQFGQRSMGGDDFNGETFYTGSTEAYFVPEIEPGNFFGIAYDFRAGILGGGIGYTYGKHDWKWAGLSADPAKVKTHFIDFDFRLHFMPRQQVQPFGLLGFSFNGIQVEDGKYDASSDSLKDMSMWGMGLNYGAGVDVYVERKIKLSGGAKWHLDGYNSISGQDLDEGLTCHGVNLFVSVGISVG